MGETGVEISHKYPTNLFIGETKPKREKKRTRETAQILQKVSKKDEAKHKMFHQAESRWGPFQKRERPPNCLTKLVKITQATLINLVHFYFFLMQWWIDLTLIYITWLPFSDLINLVKPIQTSCYFATICRKTSNYYPNNFIRDNIYIFYFRIKHGFSY